MGDIKSTAIIYAIHVKTFGMKSEPDNKPESHDPSTPE